MFKTSRTKHASYAPTKNCEQKPGRRELNAQRLNQILLTINLIYQHLIIHQPFILNPGGSFINSVVVNWGSSEIDVDASKFSENSENLKTLNARKLENSKTRKFENSKIKKIEILKTSKTRKLKNSKTWKLENSKTRKHAECKGRGGDLAGESIAIDRHS